jgi:three-Cys-motif partner protein
MPRFVGDWTRDKLRILSLYLPGYLQATTSARERIYVDAFAGPGTNILNSGVVIDGSPLIALKAQARNHTRFSRLFFIERDEASLAELRSNVTPWADGRTAEVIPGDVNTELPLLFQRLPKRSPTFVFLDTDGIEPKWKTIEAIADWQVEFLINFPLGMSINRNPDSQKTLDYFGTDECLPILHGSRSGRTRALLDLYKSRLAELGFGYTTENDLLVKTIDNRRLYYLIFVSKVEPAESIMNWVFRQPDVRGQGQLGL